MSDGSSNPPRLAIWLLRHACPGENEALTGDLIESFREGKSPGWLWTQVLIAFAEGILGKMRRQWPYWAYAIAGTALPMFLPRSVHETSFWLIWWTLPWPWSRIVFAWSPTALPALAALPVLGAGLAINRAFRWLSLARTAVINLGLLVIAHYLIDLSPWIIPRIVLMLSFFSSFLIAASIGCLPARRAYNLEKQAMS